MFVLPKPSRTVNTKVSKMHLVFRLNSVFIGGCKPSLFWLQTEKFHCRGKKIFDKNRLRRGVLELRTRRVKCSEKVLATSVSVLLQKFVLTNWCSLKYGTFDLI